MASFRSCCYSISSCGRSKIKNSNSKNPLIEEEDDDVVDDSIEIGPRICFGLCASDIAMGNAFDLILVESPLSVACGDVIFSFPPINIMGHQPENVLLEVKDTKTSEALQFPVHFNKIRLFEQLGSGMQERLYQHDYDHDEEALRKLAFALKPGKNPARYILLDHEYKEVIGVANMNIFLWSHQDRLMIVDIDGTITRSNVRGIFDTVVTERYSYTHKGVCRFLSNLDKSVRFIFLTSRPIALANRTRRFLSRMRQEEGCQLPAGALIGFPGSLMEVLFMELVSHSVHEFKLKSLLKHVTQVFAKSGASNVFLAGIGNSLMDMQAYHAAGLDLERIYLIDKESTIYCLNNIDAQVPTEVSDFLLARGTRFDGYHDENFLAQIQRQIG